MGEEGPGGPGCLLRPAVIPGPYLGLALSHSAHLPQIAGRRRRLSWRAMAPERPSSPWPPQGRPGAPRPMVGRSTSAKQSVKLAVQAPCPRIRGLHGEVRLRLRGLGMLLRGGSWESGCAAL